MYLWFVCCWRRTGVWHTGNCKLLMAFAIVFLYLFRFENKTLFCFSYFLVRFLCNAPTEPPGGWKITNRNSSWENLNKIQSLFVIYITYNAILQGSLHILCVHRVVRVDQRVPALHLLRPTAGSGDGQRPYMVISYDTAKVVGPFPQHISKKENKHLALCGKLRCSEWSFLKQNLLLVKNWNAPVKWRVSNIIRIPSIILLIASSSILLHHEFILYRSNMGGKHTLHHHPV